MLKTSPFCLDPVETRGLRSQPVGFEKYLSEMGFLSLVKNASHSTFKAWLTPPHSLHSFWLPGLEGGHTGVETQDLVNAVIDLDLIIALSETDFVDTLAAEIDHKKRLFYTRHTCFFT